MPERFTYKPRTETGTLSELTARIPIGIKRRNEYVAQGISRVEKAFEKMTKPTSELLSGQTDPDVQKPLSESQSRTFKAGLRAWADRDIQRLQAIADEPFILDFTSPISEAQKRALFEPPLAAILDRAREYDVGSPNSEDVLGNVHIVNGKCFESLYMQEFGEEPENTIAVVLPNNLCFVNYAAATRIAEEEERSIEEVLQHGGVHEAVHLLDYQEIWVNPNNSVNIRQKRSGLALFPPELSLPIKGLHLLSEAFTEYRMRWGIQKAGIPVMSGPYDAELRVLNILMRYIDEGTFYRAAMTKDGIFEFFNMLQSLYGRPAIKLILEQLYLDSLDKDLAAKLDEDVQIYKKTEKLLTKTL